MDKFLSLVCAIGLCSGCSSWPEEGRGGWAEIYHPDAPISTNGFENALPFQVMNEFEHLSLKLEWLKNRGIKHCMPGQVYQAELMLTRINRTLSAEMYAEAQLDLRSFYHQLHQLENHFERVISNTHCVSENKTDDTKLIKKLEELLNSDNQFAFDSFEVTPKYRIRLAQSAELLKMSPETQVLLVGHTDIKGSKISNFELAYKRAESVKSWLTLYGVRPELVSTLAQGALLPFTDEEESAQKQHSDRRVSAYILSTSSRAAELTKVKPLSEWTSKLEQQE
ncbi:OmpA family protein [Pseudoalteromonas sp.]|uniref:OmpA family protein n=1 Tax=Pseudoalteromonas sp. TaxID=53249 RepID=UPI0035697640